MGWEIRNGSSYYYRKVREGGRVRSIYIGSGILAQKCAKDDNDRTRNYVVVRADGHVLRQAEAEIDRQIEAAEAAIVALTRAALFAAGYHQHKGQWRRKRCAE